MVQWVILIYIYIDRPHWGRRVGLAKEVPPLELSEKETSNCNYFEVCLEFGFAQLALAILSLRFHSSKR